MAIVKWLWLLLLCVNLWAAVPADEKYYCAIAIPHTLCSATPASYPFPWILRAAAMPTGATGLWINCNATDGRDIRFTSDSAGVNALHCEIKNFNQATPTATFYIGLTAAVGLTNTTDGTVYVWYGSTTATMPAASDTTWGSQGVWDNNYLAVYHYGIPSLLALTDSTSNGDTLSNSGCLAGTGVIDGALAFNGSSYIYTSAINLKQPTNLTIENWAYQLAFNYYGGYFTNFNSPPVHGILFRPDTVAGFDFYYVNNSNVQVGGQFTGLFPTSIWTHLAVTYDGSTLRGYYNSVASVTTFSQTGGTTGDVTAYIGNDWGPSYYLPGGTLLCEQRISNIARSADWIKTGYNNQNNLSTSGTAGTPVPYGPATPKTNPAAIMPLVSGGGQ